MSVTLLSRREAEYTEYILHGGERDRPRQVEADCAHQVSAEVRAETDTAHFNTLNWWQCFRYASDRRRVKDGKLWTK